ncbi:uncharacterized protein LOC123683043 [Harmonia axyridis]|uniref:uncharacterized protein LOC123683043 n=1 Tax=Harmonia axyridis TaxID=115357 RepID=UPI001E2768E5|nr:uncharacterized protein LOC123683043 [Harmonia axyridis]
MEKLMRDSKKYTPLEHTRTVINLSSKTLSDDQKYLLDKGLKFSIAPKNVPKIEVMLAAEETAQRIQDPEKAEEYRWKIRTALDSTTKQPESNINRAEQRALKELKSDPTIKILPADKGNATVIMDVDQYNEKIKEVLEAGEYKKLKKDPTSSVENRVYRTLHKYKDEFPDPYTRSRLTPHYSKPPHIYGLPKIHKENIPLRPIVSSRNSPCHSLAKFLLKIISPLRGHTTAMVKNTEHFIETMRTQEILNQDTMVKRHVSSLFTNVPTDQTLEIVRKKLEEDQTLAERTTLSINAIMDMLSVCIKTTYFQVDNIFYQQEFGMAMGSPLSPVLADIYMEDFEGRALDQYVLKPKLWRRYVDDTFVIWPHGKETITGFLEHLNNIEESIKFTMEIEENEQLPFLDVLIHKQEGIPRTTIYRKPTNTGQYLHFESNHNLNTKFGVARCLYDRATQVCSSLNDKNEEFDKITEILEKNGYPKRILEIARTPRENTEPRPETKTESTETITTVIPYVRGLSEKLRRIGNRYGVRTAFQTKNTVRANLTKVKPDNENQRTKNCIYEIPCECGRSYIGETKRPLDTRVKEHQKLARLGETEKSRLVQHAWDEEHRIKWDEASIISKEERSKRRKLKEAAFMAITPNPISMPSLEIKEVWAPIIRSDLRKLNPVQVGSTLTPPS